jgi:hypothetical protein
VLVKGLVQTGSRYSGEPRRLGYIAASGNHLPAEVFNLADIFVSAKIMRHLVASDNAHLPVLYRDNVLLRINRIVAKNDNRRTQLFEYRL